MHHHHQHDQHDQHLCLLERYRYRHRHHDGSGDIVPSLLVRL
jgi:hypothetical protein